MIIGVELRFSSWRLYVRKTKNMGFRSDTNYDILTYKRRWYMAVDLTIKDEILETLKIPKITKKLKPWGQIFTVCK